MAVHHNTIRLHSFDLGVAGTRKIGLKGNHARLVASNAHNYDMMDSTGKHFTLKDGVTNAIADTSHGPVQIKFAPVIGHIRMFLEEQFQIT